jgi:NADPH:quinone reductase-like Zn-dependent oxidoreductase
MWNLGDEVMGITAGGGYAERIAIHERQVMPVPRAVGVRDAGAIPEVWLTAWDALVLQGGLTSERTALVHAGGSGVGTAAIQLVKNESATVIVTASKGKVAPCVALGADRAVDYTSEDFVDVVREFTGGQGADVILDVIAGDYVDRNIAALASLGRIVQVGAMATGKSTVNIAALMPKRGTIIGTVLRSRPIEEKIALTQRFAREVLPWFEQGKCHPVIDRHFPLEQIGEAHKVLEANANFGKVVIDVKAP